MNDNQWKNIIDGFQKKGGFEISDEQQDLWKEMYVNKRVDAVVKSFKGFLMERKDHRTPQPAQLYPLYKNACTEIDRSNKAQQQPTEAAKPIELDKLKAISSNANYDIMPIITTRAHNLCRLWRGFNGYDNHGRVIGETGFDKFGAMNDEAIRAKFGDPKIVVENEAARQAHKYTKIRVPKEIAQRVG